MATSTIELGFLEKRVSWKLLSKYFPSKVGGRPAWLHLKNLPNSSDLICSACSNPLVFLLQIYAPLESKESTFHRTVFIFVCRKGCNDSFVVFRNQLPLNNDCYPPNPPEYKEKESSNPSAGQFHPLCRVCGCLATIKCPNCPEDYCSENHRVCDWEWNHKNACMQDNNGAVGKKSKNITNKFLLPEYDVVTETEELPPVIPEKSDEEKMREFSQFMRSSKAPKELQDMNLDDLEEVAKKNDKAYNKFRKRVIEWEPEQVLRYQRQGLPLWVSAEHVPSPSDIPDCSCGSKRVFEFQIMPQLLNHLSLDTMQYSLDWGTLAVYTCLESCDQGVESYVKEFVWKQDFSADHRQ